jgi:hypothetical protein
MKSTLFINFVYPILVLFVWVYTSSTIDPMHKAITEECLFPRSYGRHHRNCLKEHAKISNREKFQCCSIQIWKVIAIRNYFINNYVNVTICYKRSVHTCLLFQTTVYQATGCHCRSQILMEVVLLTYQDYISEQIYDLNPNYVIQFDKSKTLGITQQVKIDGELKILHFDFINYNINYKLFQICIALPYLNGSLQCFQISQCKRIIKSL